MTNVDVPISAHGGPSGDDDDRVKIDFSVSLNAFGPAPHVVDAARSAPIDSYPDPTSKLARHAASVHWNCPIDTIVFGAGASQLIYGIARALLGAEDRVLILAPTFGEYQRAAMTAGATVCTTLWNLDTSSIALDAVCSEIDAIHPKLTFVCTPNNPTGTVITKNQLVTLANVCHANGGALVIDQSFDAFAAVPSGTPVLRGHPSVIHLRSITKDHALAGIRAGFAIAPPHIVRAIEQALPPWSTSTVAQAAAISALSDAGERHLTKTNPVLRAERERIARECTEMGIRALPSETHTLLLHVKDAPSVSASLFEEYGIRVRDCTSFGLPEYIRIAARTPEENDLFLQAIRDNRIIRQIAGEITGRVVG